MKFLKFILVTVLLSTFLSYNASSQVYAKSISVLTPTPLTCDSIKFSLGWESWCKAYTFTGYTYSITGTVITISVNYSFSGICAGTGTPITGTASFKGIPTGTYSVVFQAVLNSSASRSVNMTGNLVVNSCCAVSSIIIGDTTSYCLGDTVKLKSSATNSTKDRWYVNGILKDSTSTFNYIAQSAGADSITLITDTTTCSDTSFTSFQILADPKLMNDTSVCLNDIIFVTAPSGWNKYKWSNGKTGTIINSISTGTYALTVTAHSGCQKVDSATITHVGPTFSLGQDTFYCSGSSIDLVVDSHWKGVRWSYNAGDTNRTKTVDSDGTYVAEVTNSFGCKFTDTVNVSEADTVLNVMGSDSVCFGGMIKLFVSPGNNNLIWSTGSTNDTITVGVTGTYSATAVTSKGCKSGGSAFAKINDVPNANLGNDTTKCNGDSFTITPGNFKKYKWIFGSTTKQFIVSNAGTYWVEVEDFNSCKGYDTIVVASIKCDTTVTDTSNNDTTVFVPFISSNQLINIYPNPAQDHLIIESLNTSKLSSGYILDLNGRIISKIEITSSKINKIDLSLISTGSYVLTLKFEDGVQVRKKLIIE